VLQNGEVLLAYNPEGMGVHPTMFFQKGVKIGLKCSVGASKFLEPKGLA